MLRSNTCCVMEYATEQEVEEMKEIVPIDLLTNEEFEQAVEISRNGYLQSVKYISKSHPELGLKISKTYFDLYIKPKVPKSEE